MPTSETQRVHQGHSLPVLTSAWRAPIGRDDVFRAVRLLAMSQGCVRRVDSLIGQIWRPFHCWMRPPSTVVSHAVLGGRRGPRVFGGNPSREPVWCRLLRTGRGCTVGTGSSPTAPLVESVAAPQPQGPSSRRRPRGPCRGCTIAAKTSTSRWLDPAPEFNHIFASGLTPRQRPEAASTDRRRHRGASRRASSTRLDSAVRELRSDAFNHALRDRDDARLRASQHDLRRRCTALMTNSHPPHYVAAPSAGMSLAASSLKRPTRFKRRLSNDPPRRRCLP